MATFAMCEALIMIFKKEDKASKVDQISLQELGSMKLEQEEKKEMIKTWPKKFSDWFFNWCTSRSRSNNCFFSLRNGKKLGKRSDKEKFGKGSVRGLAAPESANNAACSGSFVPLLLTLGIPGSGTTAIMLGALPAFGIQPGPNLYNTNPDIFWSVIISMYIGNIVLFDIKLAINTLHCKITCGSRKCFSTNDYIFFSHWRIPDFI